IEFDDHSNEEIRKVKSFKEKPNAATAEKYIESGHFAWNAGIFIWPLNAILEAFKIYANQIHSTLHQGLSSLNTTDESLFIETAYPKTEKISVDYAILEKSDNVWTIPCDLGWSDLGTWASLYEQSTKDPSGNVQFGKPVFLENTTASLVYSDAARLLVIKGLDDYIVVDTKDCLLIFPKSDEQAIKQLKEKLRKQGLDEFL
ncbi:MAG TPA: sugar phosphate nucleotidyltransferase, partial [Saprospiraceae bacterium]|nr:sugar phosphate nucleotidyltransferase [Saprospiraceae bacterium]